MGKGHLWTPDLWPVLFCQKRRRWNVGLLPDDVPFAPWNMSTRESRENSMCNMSIDFFIVHCSVQYSPAITMLVILTASVTLDIRTVWVRMNGSFCWDQDWLAWHVPGITIDPAWAELCHDAMTRSISMIMIMINFKFPSHVWIWIVNMNHVRFVHWIKFQVASLMWLWFMLWTRILKPANSFWLSR